jgi:Na+-translocating ferredoxin:NAD+ oxidoreductase subunit D
MENSEKKAESQKLGGPHLIVSPSPHFHSASTVSSIMLWVIIALLPACVAGVWFFGIDAVRVLSVSLASCIILEYMCTKLMKRRSELDDLSAAVTGLLLGMNLPSNTPSWICVVGAFFAIVIGKMIYGGIGCNPFNPALVGRVALLIAFPAIMTTWPVPRGSSEVEELRAAKIAYEQTKSPENSNYVITCATPLKYSKEVRTTHKACELMTATPWAPEQAQCASNDCTLSHYWQLFLGIGKGGSLGETCGLALLAGGILLICLNIIRWQIPLFYLLTVALITGIAHLVAPQDYANPLFHLLTGGLLLGAFFMATDMVTTPLSRTGAIIFAIGCGVITAAIRLKGSYPEGVSFSILIMNAFTPLIDRFTSGKPFGMPKKKGLLFAR